MLWLTFWNGFTEEAEESKDLTKNNPQGCGKFVSLDKPRSDRILQNQLG